MADEFASLAGAARSALESVGVFHVTVPLTGPAFLALAEALGRVVGKEVISLRPDAHAYVAKPGPVPLHTDHPAVALIGWHCAKQDDIDGASLLLDSWHVVAGLQDAERVLLGRVELVCPALEGGASNLPVPRVARTAGATESLLLAVADCGRWKRRKTRRA